MNLLSIKSYSVFVVVIWSVAIASDTCVDELGNPVTEIFGKSGDCEHFYQCNAAGQEVQMACPPGTAFNPDNKVCDQPYNVDGCEHVDGIDESDVYCKDEDGSFNNVIYFSPTTCKYYRCDNGQSTEYNCAPGTVYNPDKGICDHESNVPAIDCAPSVTESTTASAVVINPTTPEDLPTEIPLPEISDACINEDGSWNYDIFLDSVTCKYYQCANGEANEIVCQPGLVYNPDIGVCDWEDNVSACVLPTEDPPTEIPLPEKPDACINEDGSWNYDIFLDPVTCKYYQCANGEANEIVCQPGLAYNPDIGVCDWEDNVSACVLPTEDPLTEIPLPEKPDACINEDGSWNYDIFLDPVTCKYYQCANGEANEIVCQPGLAYNPDIGVCDWEDNVSECVPSTDETTTLETTTTVEPVTDVHEPIDVTTKGPDFKPTTDGHEPIHVTTKVPDAEPTTDGHETIDVTTKSSDVTPVTDGHEPNDAASTVPDKVTKPDVTRPEYDHHTKAEATEIVTSTSTTTTLEKTTNVEPVTDGHEPIDVTAKVPDFKPTTNGHEPIDATTKVPHFKTTTDGHETIDVTTSSDVTPVTDGHEPSDAETTVPHEVTKPSVTRPGYDHHTKAETTEIVTPASTTTAGSKYEKKSFVAFVIDDTGSMSNEILAVKEWLTNCIYGKYADCKVAPTGGWILSTFNDPTVGEVVGPTTDLSTIIEAVGELRASGGGDCPEKAITGLRNAVSGVPDENSACKVFFFTDATGNDDELYDETKDLFHRKDCTFLPMLTGCCGTCADPCTSLSDEYCDNHVIDDTTTSHRGKRSVPSGTFSLAFEELYYELASTTGGNIYLTDKPTSADDFLDFLEEEVTLGFCPTDLIAGPPPNGYTSEHDCNITNSCWDRTDSKCYCQSATEPCPKDPIAPPCDDDDEHSFTSDVTDCSMYYECSRGTSWHRPCASGTIFDPERLVCDHPRNVKPPCGTLTSK